MALLAVWRSSLLGATAPMSPSIARRARPWRMRDRCVAAGKARGFSAAGIRPADVPKNMQRMMKDMQKRKAMPSQTSVAAQNLDELPNDVGLMPGTFVRPTGASLPTLFGEPRLRLKMELHWAKTRFLDLVSRFVYKWTTVKKPRPVISRRGLARLALRLHKDMYTAFAFGDVDHLSRICADGIYRTLRMRINERKSNERLYWTRLSHSRPRIVSDRVAKLPVPGVNPRERPTCVRQIIFRINSRQALVRGYVRRDRTGSEKLLDEASAELPVGDDREVIRERMEQSARSVQEYFVLQKRLWLGKEEDWLVWGLVDESSADDVE